MEITGDYLSENEDFRKFLIGVSDNTGKRNTSNWIKNIKDNVALFKKTGWACPQLQDVEIGKTAIIMGASPAIRKQASQLWEIQNNPNFVLCGLSSNLEWLLNNEIKPRYCITIDADASQADYWEDLDMDLTKDITLITSTLAYPPMLLRWKGPIWFLALASDDEKVQKLHRDNYKNLNGNGQEFPSMMGQFNIMAAFAFLTLGCPILIFVGNELSYATESSTYYVGRKDYRDSDRSGKQGDIHGNLVDTNLSLLALKMSLERFLETVSGAGWFFNCTEAGIFGVTKRYPKNRVPWVHQLTLKAGIAQAKSIMNTGKPLTITSTGDNFRMPDLGGMI